MPSLRPTPEEIEYLLSDDLAFIHLLTIRDKRDRLVHFMPNAAQIDFYNNMTGRDLVLKARQMGFSTFIQALQYKRVTTRMAVNAATISHDRPSTAKLRDKFKMFYRHLPDEFKPQMSKDDKLMSVFTALESSSYIGTAGNKVFGRGDTLSQVHLSELAFWPDPEALLPGILEAVPDRHVNPDSSVIIESTANGAQGVYFEMCMEALEHPERSEFKLHFYAWWWDVEYQLPLAKGEKIEYSPEELALVERHNLTAAQIKWRRVKMLRLGEKFFQEYPEDPVSCFLNSGRARFDVKALKIRLDGQCHDPIEERLHVTDEKEETSARWRIYEPPEEGHIYIIGADPSEGISQDSAAAVVRDYYTNHQVATLHGQFELVDFTLYLTQLGHFYNYALIAVERNNHGHTVLNYLMTGTERFDAYGNIYVADDGKPGWHTNHVTRSPMIDDLADEIRYPDEYVIHDKAIIHQMMQFVVKYTRTFKEHAEAQRKAYDDLVMAEAITSQVRKLMPAGPAYEFINTNGNYHEPFSTRRF